MTADANVMAVDDTNFEKEVLSVDGAVLVEFGAPWCPPCRAMEPTLARLAAEESGRVQVVTVDTDVARSTAARYGIRGVPTVLVFRNGQRTAVHVGLASKEKLQELLAR